MPFIHMSFVGKIVVNDKIFIIINITKDRLMNHQLKRLSIMGTQIVVNNLSYNIYKFFSFTDGSDLT